MKLVHVYFFYSLDRRKLSLALDFVFVFKWPARKLHGDIVLPFPSFRHNQLSFNSAKDAHIKLKFEYTCVGQILIWFWLNILVVPLGLTKFNWFSFRSLSRSHMDIWFEIQGGDTSWEYKVIYWVFPVKCLAKLRPLDSYSFHSLSQSHMGILMWNLGYRYMMRMCISMNWNLRDRYIMKMRILSTCIGSIG